MRVHEKKHVGFGYFLALKSKSVYLNLNVAVIWTSAFSKVAKRSEILLSNLLQAERKAVCCMQMEGTIFASFVSF